MCTEKKNNPVLFLSIIIATYNRSKHLRESLEAWSKQNFSKGNYEIIVVDNGSPDDTQAVCREFRTRHPEVNFRYEFLETPCLSCARNRGIELARGKYVAFVDDDARPGAHYIANFFKRTQEFPAVQAFGGRVLPRYETGQEPVWMSKYLQRLLSFVDMGDKVKTFNKKYPVGCNMLFRKDLFDEIGVFDIPAGYRSEDKHFFLKVKRAGKKVLYLPDVIVYHFIDAWRLTEDYVKNVSCKNGCSDNKMYELFDNSFMLKIKHLVGLLFKLSISLFLWAGFIVKGQKEKGKYLFLSMWHTLRGFAGGCQKCHS